MPSLPYIAGFVDGEGHVRCSVRKDTPVGWAFAVVIANNDLRALEAIQKEIGGRIYRRKRYSPRHRQGYVLSIAGRKKVRALLEVLLPYLIVKREAAERCLRAIATVEVLSKAAQQGESNPNAKLSDAQRAAIARRYIEGGISQEALAAEFGVHQTRVSQITRGA